MMGKWRCQVCGYIHDGDGPPDVCPKCGAPKDKFVQLSKEDTDKIYAADRTNDIHMTMVKKLADVIALCEEGIRINLDPGCLATFQKARDEAWIMKQRCKAEMATHMTKNKW